MLRRTNDGTKEILHATWLSLCNNLSEEQPTYDQRDASKQEETVLDVFTITRTDNIISRKQAENIQRILRTLMANIEENVAQITLWQNREKDRLAERPRWTFQDESRFRVIIHKLQVSNEHAIRELNRLHTKIFKLEESLVKKLEMIRSDLEERRGGETQLFTWVTVVFLPLGFATGVFSMSEAPTIQTLHSMIVTAVVAFVSIALLGPVVKTIISADLIRQPDFTNWNRKDWSDWQRDLRGTLKTPWEASTYVQLQVVVDRWKAGLRGIGRKIWDVLKRVCKMMVDRWELEFKARRRRRDFTPRAEDVEGRRQ
ncbi:hypothetical protein GCG54_00007557 [Colletotrichum gloeosporioides]|uniref:Uncharacterized protein n=1 Tax=Colletotrichum gloeosporioides TaxID=474922 RepID=A0A8H4CPM6_COLGL|nr:uncharacterized protein GCG54_00007557 [Colletotrichum gloeosporioides]KAF3807823.1 hypothetical protein GCG54_00007557 [Colletotrichum gloeosporioides]